MAILLTFVSKAKVFQNNEIYVEGRDYILLSNGTLPDVTPMSARITLPFETQLKLTHCPLSR